MKGRYSDGRSAAAHDVDASLEGDALVIQRGAERIVWPLTSLRRIDAGDPTRLVIEPDDGDPNDSDGAQLAIPFSESGPLLDIAPQLRRAYGERTARLAVGLTAAAAAIVGFVFFGLPALSGPLARAVPPATEIQLGERTLAVLDILVDDCAVGDDVQATLDELGQRFEDASGAPFDIEITLVDAAFPNAFALPGGKILVTDELLAITERPEELAGVLAHETAHVARRHVMAAMLRELGYGFVLDLVLGGGSGAGQQIALAGASLDSLRHGRNAEAEADALALSYLEAMDIDGTGLAQFFERLNEYLEREGVLADLDVPELLSTHPDTLRRAELARAAAGASRTPAMSDADWELVRTACGPISDDEAGGEVDKTPEKPGPEAKP